MSPLTEIMQGEQNTI